MGRPRGGRNIPRERITTKHAKNTKGTKEHKKLWFVFLSVLRALRGKKRFFYSDVADRSFNIVGQKFLRGSQVTDANGIATFTTIYPGWYQGRTVHIHFKVQSTSSTVFTSQLFFDDTFTDHVFTQAPYASKGTRNTLNSNDNIYKQQLLLNMNKTDQGYAATFDIGMNAV